MLAFPHWYAARLPSIPTAARALPPVKPGKRKDYLAVAQALLNMIPTEATRRSVEFLMHICNRTNPVECPSLEWLEEEPQAPRIELGLPSALGRVAPVVRLCANVGR